MSDVRPPTTDASLGELFSQLTTDLSGLVRDEVELAKVELKEDISDVGRAGGMLEELRSPVTWPSCWCPSPPRGASRS